MLLNIAFLFFWPILQGTPVYTELSKFWNRGETIETGLAHPIGAVVCPSPDSSAGWLVAADSSGKMMELRYDGVRWSVVRTFPAGAPLVTLCSGAAYPDMEFRLYAGTKAGQVLEISRGTIGWSKREIVQLPGPIKAVVATDAAAGGVVSRIFAIDGDGKVAYLLPPPGDKASPSAPGSGRWSAQFLPEMPGGASQLATNMYKASSWVVAAGPTGLVYRYIQDSLGQWSSAAWTKMAAGAKCMAPSADPSMRDVAVYYSGTDGLFRYLFYGYTDDMKARVPVADGITNLIGAGNQRRFNEFFGVTGDEFSMFEFDFEDKAWHKVPIGKIDPPAVSATFGYGRNEPIGQMYVTCANGKVYEFVRYKMK